MDKLSDKRRFFLICLALALITFAVFWQLHDSDFVNYDDDEYVTENPHVMAGLTRDGVIWAFTKHLAGNWHPLTSISHMLDCQLFGLNPAGHHLTGLLLHVVNTLLLFSVVRAMTGALWRSAFVAALFALHPLHVESVAWISERKDVLSTLFWLLTMAAYLRYVKRPGPIRYMLVLLAFALGLMAKSMVVTLPFVLLLLDYWPLDRFQNGRLVNDAEKPDHKSANARSHWPVFYQLLWEKVPFFILSAVISVVTFLVEHSIGAVGSIHQLPLMTRILNAPVSYVAYIGKMIRPSRLAIFYPYPAGTLLKWQAAPAALVLLVICVCVSRFARKHRFLLTGWLWYLGTLVPVIGLVQVGRQAIADRYTYIPLIGPFIIIAWGVPAALAMWRYKKPVLAASAVVVLFALTICTSLQLRHWRNSVTLFEHALDVTADNHVAHTNLGHALLKQDKFTEAAYHFYEVLRLKPNHTNARSNLGAAMLLQGKIDESITHFTEVLRQVPDNAGVHYAGVHYNLGNALVLKGKIDEAIAHYTESLRLNPDNAETHHQLADVLAQQCKFDQAILHYAGVLRLQSDSVNVRYKLAGVLAKQGRYNEAVTHFSELLQLTPDSPDVLNNLAWLLATHQQAKFHNPSEAVRLAERACRLTDYKRPAMLDTLAAAYAAAGRFPDAVTTAEKAVELAVSAGKKDMTQEIQGRIQLYKTGQCYRAPAPVRDDSNS